MTPRQLKLALTRLDLTQVGLARLLKVDPRTVRRWIAGDLRMPHPVHLLLGCWLQHGVTS
jgi:DNA-binding transcriptional regulator YiaG